MHKIFFLYKSNSSLKIYLYFFRTKLLNIFFKRKIIHLKTTILIDKLWDFKNVLYYKFKLKEILISV